MKYLVMLLAINAIGIMLAISGCVSTGSTVISDDTIKVLTEAVSKLDKEQVKKLERAIKEKLKDEDTKAKDNMGGTGTGDIKTEETEQEAENKDKNSESVDKSKIIDAFPLSDLTINVSVDSPQLIRHYTNGWATEHPWALIKDLPVTVNIDYFNSEGVLLSGSTVKEGKYENGKWERTSCFWAFDENGNELGYEDNAYTHYPEPGKFYGRAKYILVVSCSDYGDTFNLTGRSRVMEVR